MRAALGERRVEEDVVADGEQVEGDERSPASRRPAGSPATRPDGCAAAARRSRARAVGSAGRRSRRRPRSARAAPACSGGEQLGEVAGQRPLVAAAQLDLVAVAEHDAAEAVPLRLVQPSVAVGSSSAALASMGDTGGMTGRRIFKSSREREPGPAPRSSHVHEALDHSRHPRRGHRPRRRRPCRRRHGRARQLRRPASASAATGQPRRPTVGRHHVAAGGRDPHHHRHGSGHREGEARHHDDQPGRAARDNTANGALDQANEKATQLIATLKAAGVQPDDITTTDVSIYPQYDSAGQHVVGYNASNQVVARFKDLTKAGEVIDAAASAVGDAITLGGVSFSIDDTGALKQQARVGAVEHGQGPSRSARRGRRHEGRPGAHDQRDQRFGALSAVLRPGRPRRPTRPAPRSSPGPSRCRSTSLSSTSSSTNARRRAGRPGRLACRRDRIVDGGQARRLAVPQGRGLPRRFAERPSSASTPRASCWPASGSSTSSTRARSTSSTCWPATARRPPGSRSAPTPTASSPGGARSTAARCSCSARTSPSSAGPSARCSPRRSTRSWTSPLKVGAPRHRPQRRRRRPHPGRRRVARQLRRHLPPQRAGVGRRPADLRDPRPVRRRRRVLPGDDRLHLHGATRPRTCSSPVPTS